MWNALNNVGCYVFVKGFGLVLITIALALVDEDMPWKVKELLYGIGWGAALVGYGILRFIGNWPPRY
jgi:hypothetical protein